MPLKLAIVGRPNVGKSTLFNRLAGRRLAIVNDQPGVTRDRRTAPGRLGDIDLELIDTAGFEDVSDESLEARMRAQTEAARALTYYAAAQTDFGKLGDEAAAMRAEILIPLVKAHATDIGCEVASLGIQVHGGMGFTWDVDCHLYYRRSRQLSLVAGAPRVWKERLVSQLEQKNAA